MNGLNKTLNIQVNLKSICNLRCKYCSLPEISKSTNSDENKILRNTKLLLYKIIKEGFIIRSFSIIGAEPFIIKSEILADVFNLIVQFFPKAILKIQTNGTLATKEYMNIFFNKLNKKYVDKLIISWSIDGVKNIHDYWRDNSFDLVIKNLFYVSSNYSNLNMVVISTGNSHYVIEKNKVELLEFIKKCKINKIIPTLSNVDYELSSLKEVRKQKIDKNKFDKNFAKFLIDNNLILNSIKHFNKYYCYRDGNNCSKILFDISTGSVYQCEKGFDISIKPLANYFFDSIEKCIKNRKKITCNAYINDECLVCEYKDWCKSECMLRRTNGKSNSCLLIKDVLSYIKNNFNKDWESYIDKNSLNFINVR